MKSLKFLVLFLLSMMVISITADDKNKGKKQNAVNNKSKNLSRIQARKFGKITPFFYPNNEERFYDKGLPELGDYSFKVSKAEEKHVDDVLSKLKPKADKKVTINGRSMSRKEWEDFFQNNSFSNQELKDAQKEWLETKHQVESIKDIQQPPKTKQKQNESPDQYKDRLKRNEYKYREQVRKVGNPKVNDYLNRLESKEKNDGKVYQSAAGVNQTAEESSTEGLNKLGDKFKDCKEC